MNKYITIGIDYICNNNCKHCFLDKYNIFSKLNYNEYCNIINKIVTNKEYNSLILSGGEITLTEDLNKYITYAKDKNYFKKIQIQTNARKLSDIEYCSKIIELGVNEFFISICGSNAEKHDSITNKSGSFLETIEGIKNLSKFKNINIIPNIVISSLNYEDIENIFRFILQFKKIEEIHLWKYLERNILLK